MQLIPPTAFDLTILQYLNTYAQQSETFDGLIGFLSGNHLLKGGVLMMLFWWAWFREKDFSPVRARLVATLAASFLAICIARLLALSLPFRYRPMHDETIAFQLPSGMSTTLLGGWSSFPSDHAVLYFALAAGLFCASRTIGIVALIYTAVFIALPRVYLGLHHPTDILAGAFIGLALALLFQLPLMIRVIGKPMDRWSQLQPGAFYALLFLLTYQIADIFNSARAIAMVSAFLIMR